MDRKTYDKTTEKEFVGKKVKSLIPLSNGLYKIPAGTIWTIQRKWKGFGLWSDPCLHCGVRVHISDVSPRDVDFANTAGSAAE